MTAELPQHDNVAITNPAVAVVVPFKPDNNLFIKNKLNIHCEFD